MGAEARLLKLEEKLSTLGFNETLRAVDLMKREMSAAKGFKRHDGSDYYHHLVMVALLLINAGIKDEPTLTASLLHDFPEDVEGITVETVRHMFGQEVAEAVQPLTKSDKVDYKDLNNLKEYYKPILENWRSSLVKAADIMHNMSTLGDAKKEKKIRKIQEAKEVYIPFLREVRNKYPRFAPFFYLAKFAIEPIIRGMEDRYTAEDAFYSMLKETAWAQELEEATLG
jgi:guanosine-3',5'-bis(diphosphate) 3'-pyrophosphohydrolase